MAEVQEGGREYNVNSVTKAIKIIQFLTEQAPKGFAMVELQHALDLKKSTLFLLLNTLVRERLVDFNAEKRVYTPGIRLLEWGSSVGQENSLKGLAPLFLQKLTDLTRETSHLAILDGNAIVFIDKVESPEPLKMSTRVGVRLPLHIPATAKVLVAYAPESSREKLIQSIEFKKCTENTILDAESYRNVLEKVVVNGYGLDDEEVYIGTRCAGAPIFDSAGRVIAAIGITAPAMRFTRERIPEITSIVKMVAAEFSSRFQTNKRTI